MLFYNKSITYFTMFNTHSFSAFFTFLGKNFFKIYFTLFLIALFLFFLLGSEQFGILISVKLLMIIFAPIIGLFFAIKHTLPFEINIFFDYLLIIVVALPILFLDKFTNFLGRKFKKLWQIK